VPQHDTTTTPSTHDPARRPGNSPPAGAAAAGRRPDRPGRAAWAVLLAVVAVGLLTDLVSKGVMFATLADVPVDLDRSSVLNAPDLSVLLPAHEPTVVVPHLLEFKLVLNAGALFGIGAGRRVFFIAATAGAIVFALWMFSRWTGRRHHAAHAAIGLVIAGGLGNLYDRVRFACVRDFIHPLPGVRYPFGIRTPWSGRELWPYVSNLADLWLIIGVAVLVIYLWRAPADAGEAEAAGGRGDRDGDTKTGAAGGNAP